MGHRVHPGLSALALALAALLWGSAPAAAADVEARVASVRPGKVYLELDRPLEVRLGARVVVRTPEGGAEVRTAVLALSSRYLVLEAPGLEALAVGDRVRLTLDAVAAPPRPPEAATGAPRVDLPVPTPEEYASKPAPTFEPVPFSGRPQGAAPGPAPAEPAEPGADAPEGPAEDDVEGELELGIDHAGDDASNVGRTTLSGRLALNVERLGGSDRARLRLYGSFRQPFDGERDLTGRGEDALIAELTALSLELDARPEDQVHAFSDRLELRLGRAGVPWVVEAGLIDGLQLGLRFGAVTAFAYAGVGAAPNPETSDWDTLAYGGGLRFAKTFAHSGALRMSLAGGQQRFREKGERDFVEAQLDGRWERLSLRGSLVIDFFDAVLDERDIRLTTGVLRLGWQFTGAVRAEVGFSERRPQYQAALVRELSPLILGFVDRHERRSLDALLSVRFGEGRRWDVAARGTLLLGRAGRDSTGGGLTLGKNDTFGRDRLSLDVLVHHRLRGAGHAHHSTDPYLDLTYAWYGEAVTWQLTAFYRVSLPDDEGDQRLGARASVDAELGHGFGVRGFADVELHRDDRESGEAFLLGLAARYRF